MNSKRFTLLGISLVFLFLILFIFFISSDVESGIQPPKDQKKIYSEALENKTSVVCELNAEDLQQGFPNKGEVYVANGKILFSFEGGEEGEGYMLMDKERDLYVWLGENGEGMIISADFIKEEGVNFGKEGAFFNTFLSDYLFNQIEEGSLFCEEESFDTDKLVLPENIDFISITDDFTQP